MNCQICQFSTVNVPELYDNTIAYKYSLAINTIDYRTRGWWKIGEFGESLAIRIASPTFTDTLKWI